MKFKKEFEVYYVNCHKEQQLRFVSLIEMLLETSIAHDRQVVQNKEIKQEAFWVLYNWDIHIMEMPKAGDTLVIETYESNVERFFAYRNFEVFCNGKKIVKAMTKWVLLNQETFAPMRISQEWQELYGIVPDECSKKDYRLSQSDRTHRQTFHVRKSDIDGNRHVNNARYIDWALEVTELENIHSFQIVYKKQTYYGETVDIYTYDTDESTEFEIRVGEETRAYGLLKK